LDVGADIEDYNFQRADLFFDLVKKSYDLVFLARICAKSDAFSTLGCNLIDKRLQLFSGTPDGARYTVPFMN